MKVSSFMNLAMSSRAPALTLLYKRKCTRLLQKQRPAVAGTMAKPLSDSDELKAMIRSVTRFID